MTRRILFAGAEQPLWAEFRASVVGGFSWAADFATSVPTAVAKIEQDDFRVVVADVQICDTCGLDFLDLVMERHPQAVRFVLSDITDTHGTVKCLGRSHHHLVRQCDLQTFLNAVDQAVSLQSWLPSARVQGLLAKMRCVPSLPSTYSRVVEAIDVPYPSLEKVAAIIAEDSAVTAKILQLANSALFGLQLQANQPVEAVGYLGLETTRTLVLLAQTMVCFGDLRLSGFSVEHLWAHSILVGRFARKIASLETAAEDLRDQAFVAGVLHDIGKLLLAANLKQPFLATLALARRERCGAWEAEMKTFGANHAEVGGCLLGIWGLPRPIVEAVALHHSPSSFGGSDFGPLTAVHAANALAGESSPDPSAAAPETLDMSYIARLGLTERVEEWRNQCLHLAAQA